MNKEHFLTNWRRERFSCNLSEEIKIAGNVFPLIFFSRFIIWKAAWHSQRKALRELKPAPAHKAELEKLLFISCTSSEWLSIWPTWRMPLSPVTGQWPHSGSAMLDFKWPTVKWLYPCVFIFDSKAIMCKYNCQDQEGISVPMDHWGWIRQWNSYLAIVTSKCPQEKKVTWLRTIRIQIPTLLRSRRSQI